MRIAIDGNEANVDRKVGISEFAYQLLSEFSKIKKENTHLEVYLKEQPNTNLRSLGNVFTFKVFGPQKLWTQFALPLRLFTKSKPDVFLSPSHYSPRFSPIPTVVSVMDLSYLHFPELFAKKDLYQLTNWTKYSVQKASAILTISNSSRDDIINQYKIPKSRIHVVYPGIKKIIDLAPHVYDMNELKNKYQISENYLLFVSTLQPRKNISRLIEAFSIARNHPTSPRLRGASAESNAEKRGKSDLQLVIVGKKGWMYEEILEAPKKFGVEDSVKFLDFVPDEDLARLYTHAKCFVFPSLYEGFGLPVLEAMQYGCPVITSNVSSLPEVGGDAALYVDPTDTNDIVEKIEKLLGSEKLRKELIAKGKKQVEKFSWEKTAKEVLSVLESVAKK